MGLLEPLVRYTLKGSNGFVPYPAYRGAKALPDTMPRLSIEQKAALNSMLLLSPVNSSELPLNPVTISRPV